MSIYMHFGNMSMQYVKDDFTLGAINFGNIQYEGKHTAEQLIKSVEGEGGSHPKMGIREI